jgi:metal-dependent amidase/aminoacylase/carboxypeptidase family protein
MHSNASDLEERYKDLHRHPELSMPEQRTAGPAADRLSAAGFEVTASIGGTGVERLVAAASAWLAA